MSTTLYPTALAALLAETLDWTAEEIKVVLLGPSFIYDPLAVYAQDIPPEHIIATAELGLANRTYEDGVARGDPAEFLQLFSNQLVTSVVLYQDVGDPAYSPLIACYDADDITGAPRAVLGEDIYVYAPVEPGGWFQVIDSDLLGLIGVDLLGSGDLSIAELDGGLSLVMPTLLIDGRLNIHTHVVCAGPDEDDDCCAPTIRSSQCD